MKYNFHYVLLLRIIYFENDDCDTFLKFNYSTLKTDTCFLVIILVLRFLGSPNLSVISEFRKIVGFL